MTKKKKDTSVRGMALFIATLINVIIIRNGYTMSSKWYYCLIVSLPLLVVAGSARRSGAATKNKI